MSGWTEGMRTSLSDRWSTPRYLFEHMDREFHFTVDVCADSTNHKCARYYDEETDGLSQDWSGEVCWMNPPYGREIGRWVHKARVSAEQGAIVVALVPARTDTRWWREDMVHATEWRFINGRVRFGEGAGSAPFPSVLAVFGTPRMPVVSQVTIREG